MKLAALLAAVSLSGCFYLVKEERVGRIEVRTIPPGAAISTEGDGGELTPRGQAPVSLETRYTASIRRFRHWAWIWPALALAGTGGGIALTRSESYSSAGSVLGGLSVVGVLVSTILCVIGEGEHGTVKSTDPESLIVVAQLPGRPPRRHTVSLLAARRLTTEAALSALPPASRPAAADAPRHAPLPRGTVVAVFDVNDLTGRLSEDERRRLTTGLNDRIFAQGLGVVPIERLHARIARLGVQRWACYPGSCQSIAAQPLANKALDTRIRRSGRECTITGALYGVWGGAAERRATTSGPCTVGELLQGLERIAAQLAAGD